MSQSPTSTITYGYMTLNFDDRNFIDKFFSIAAVNAVLILRTGTERSKSTVPHRPDGGAPTHCNNRC